MLPQRRRPFRSATNRLLDVVALADLTAGDIAMLHRLFDVEDQQDFGNSDPEPPYGCAPHDFLIAARHGSKPVGRAGQSAFDPPEKPLP